MAASANSGIADNLPREKPPRSTHTLFSHPDQIAWGETYLANYNAISAFFWFNVPLRLIQIYTRFGPEQVFDGTVDYVKYIQAMAVLEVVHSAVGIAKHGNGANMRPRALTAIYNSSASFIAIILNMGDM